MISNKIICSGIKLKECKTNDCMHQKIHNKDCNCNHAFCLRILSDVQCVPIN